MLTEPVIRRLILSRYLFELALQNVRVEQETGDAACVNLLQDAIEIFFVAAFDHCNVAEKPKTFPEYLGQLSKTLDGDLPYRRACRKSIRCVSHQNTMASFRTEKRSMVM